MSELEKSDKLMTPEDAEIVAATLDAGLILGGLVRALGERRYDIVTIKTVGERLGMPYPGGTEYDDYVAAVSERLAQMLEGYERANGLSPTSSDDAAAETLDSSVEDGGLAGS